MTIPFPIIGWCMRYGGVKPILPLDTSSHYDHVLLNHKRPLFYLLALHPLLLECPNTTHHHHREDHPVGSCLLGNK